MTAIDRVLRLSDVPPEMRDVRIWDVSARPADVYAHAVLRPGSWTIVVVLGLTCVAISAAASQWFTSKGPRP